MRGNLRGSLTARGMKTSLARAALFADARLGEGARASAGLLPLLESGSLTEFAAVGEKEHRSSLHSPMMYCHYIPCKFLFLVCKINLKMGSKSSENRP